jgi:hypothetical protein
MNRVFISNNATKINRTQNYEELNLPEYNDASCIRLLKNNLVQMKIKNKIFTFLLVLSGISFFNPQLWAQGVNITTSLDSTSIEIGDQIKFKIDIEQPANAVVKLPDFKDNTIDSAILIIGAKPADTLRQNDILKIKYEFLVTCFDSGDYEIPVLDVPYTIGSLADTFHTIPVMLKVMNIPVDTVTQVIDIKPPLKTPINFAEAWPYTAILVLLAGIIIGIWFLFNRKKKSGILSVGKRMEPPHIIALRELDNLRAQKLWQNNKVKNYYVELTEIIRKYIEYRFKVAALEMTSDEITEEFKHLLSVDQESKELLNKLFVLADLVKFAKAEPLPNENEISLLNAYQFVNNTKITDSVSLPENQDTVSDTDPNQVQNQ